MICTRCKNTFQIQEATTVYRNYGGVKIPEKKCPVCGGTFRAVEIPEDLDRFLFNDRDERYYSYENKKTKLK